MLQDLSDDVIMNVLMPLLEFCHFIQLRAVNSRLHQLITKNAFEDNNQIIKKGSQLILLKGQFKITGDQLLPFTDTMRRASVSSQKIMEEFNSASIGILFKFTDLDHAKTLSCPAISKYHFPEMILDGLPSRYLDGYYPAVYCVKCKIDLLLSPDKAMLWKNPESPIVVRVPNEYFDVVWHYDFLTGVRVYVNICTIM